MDSVHTVIPHCALLVLVQAFPHPGSNLSKQTSRKPLPHSLLMPFGTESSRKDHLERRFDLST